MQTEHPTLTKQTLRQRDRTKPSFTLCTDTQTDVLAGFPASATCVQKFDDSRVLQIALHIAFCYVLHRCGSLDIPRHGLCVNFKCGIVFTFNVCNRLQHELPQFAKGLCIKLHASNFNLHHLFKQPTVQGRFPKFQFTHMFISASALAALPGLSFIS